MILRSHPTVTPFVQAARRYCDLIDDVPAGAAESASWPEQVLAALAQLYTCAHWLPTTYDLAQVSEVALDVTTAEWRAIYQALLKRLGPAGVYWAPYDPCEPPNPNAPPDTGDLADDLADIYRDVQPVVRAYVNHDEIYLAESLNTCRNVLFNIHWGVHAVSALNVLHRLALLRGLA